MGEEGDTRDATTTPPLLLLLLVVVVLLVVLFEVEVRLHPNGVSVLISTTFIIPHCINIIMKQKGEERNGR